MKARFCIFTKGRLVFRPMKHILITGASSGIGAALAKHYAAPGVRLNLSGRNETRLAEIAEICRVRGATVETMLVDVTDRDGMARWIEAADAAQPLDLVIANAGISGGTGGVMSGEPVDQAREIFDVNLTGVLNTVGPILSRMIARRNGQIALISSLVGFRGYPSAPAYSASKGAVRFYGEALRGTLSKTGVKVNVVCPGFVVSRMTDANDFYMPMLMDADKAAAQIACGLSRNKGRIAFPLLLHCSVWFISILPDCIAQKFLSQMPSKKPIQ